MRLMRIVEFEIVGKEDYPRSHLNRLRVLKENERVIVQGGSKMVLNDKTTAGVVSHEVGHLMGADDHYSDSRNASGDVISIPNKGFEGNLMGDGTVVHNPSSVDGSVDDRNFEEIFDSSISTEVCLPTGENGRCK